MFGRSKRPPATASPMDITHDIVLDGTCHTCRTAVSGTTSHTARLGQRGTFTGTVTHNCGTEVDVTGQF